MALDSMDNLRDGLINQGIGDSGLSTQAVQRANIEELRSLRSAVGESQSKLQNDDEQRKTQLTRDFLANQHSIIGAGQSSGNAEFDGSKPNFVVTPLQGPNGPSFQLNTGGAAHDSYTFQSIEQLMGYLDEQGLKDKANIVMAGVASGVTGDHLTKFQQLGGVVTGYDKAYKLAGLEPSGNVQFGLTSGVKEPHNAANEAHTTAMENLKSNPSKFQLAQLEPNAQSKVVSNAYDQLGAQANKGINTDLYTYAKSALTLGNPTTTRAFIEFLIQEGKLHG